MRLLLVAIGVPAVLASPPGAPYVACGDMTPKFNTAKGKGHPEPQDTPAPYEVTSQEMHPKYMVTVKPKDGETDVMLRGFFVQARSKEEDTIGAKPLGMWWPKEGVNAKGVPCPDPATNENLTDSAITHTDGRDDKPSVDLYWWPPEGHVGDVIFKASVVQEVNLTWINIHSETMINLDGNQTDPPWPPTTLAPETSPAAGGEDSSQSQSEGSNVEGCIMLAEAAMMMIKIAL